VPFGDTQPDEPVDVHGADHASLKIEDRVAGKTLVANR
jgi:hypothetical protein